MIKPPKFLINVKWLVLLLIHLTSIIISVISCYLFKQHLYQIILLSFSLILILFLPLQTILYFKCSKFIYISIKSMEDRKKIKKKWLTTNNYKKWLEKNNIEYEEITKTPVL
ncbi:Uncharacterised protein [Mycoplasmopsis caviae]|uniref:Uncharacterized protein n=1 Tax=Mycoplasmopsis caviae TaxID=55603 RepID=A0A3P8MFC3_9BACT|nr:Uncharacterised protein [Mycoplasmopsis caviae]